MTNLTTDRNDPLLTRGIDSEPAPQAQRYLVLSDEEIAKGFTRPLRFAYVHDKCKSETRMGTKLSETYARDPKFYGATYCVACQQHLPVGEFKWSEDGEVVGS